MEIWAGIIVGISLIIFCVFFSRYFSYRLLATTMLVAIAFIYIGFSLQNNTEFTLIRESVASTLFYFIAITGFKYKTKLLGAGLLLHGIWDLLHLNLIDLTMPIYWPVFCCVIDVIDGVFFLLVFHKEQKII